MTMNLDGNTRLSGRLKKEVLSAVLAVGMMLSTVALPQSAVIVRAEAQDKTIIGLGTGAITDPEVPASKDSAWSGSYVYYGKYDGKPVKYRVLDAATSDFGGNTMLLDCDNTLYHHVYSYVSGIWKDSSIRTSLKDDFLEGKDKNSIDNFTAVEKASIAESTAEERVFADFVSVSDWMAEQLNNMNYTALYNDKIFLLDVEDVLNVNYGYSSDTGDETEGPWHQVRNRRKYPFLPSVDNSWWLRTQDPHTYFFDDWEKTYSAAGVYSDGHVGIHTASVDNMGVSPAFNVDLSQVIFSSLISSSKYSIEAGKPGAEYKLTLWDNDLSISVTGRVTKDSQNIINIPYNIIDKSSSDPTQVYVVVTNGTWSESGWSDGAELLQYEKLALESNSTSETGTFIFRPDNNKVKGTWGNDYHVYVLAVDVNGEKETDYTSAPVEISTPPSPSEQTYTYYRMEFDMNGHGSPVSSQWVKSGVKAKRPLDPEAKGFIFDGWYQDPGCKVLYDFESPMTGDITLYAKWVMKDSETGTGMTMHRLYNPNSGEHFYTSSSTEKKTLVAAGWSDEGIGWFAPETSNTPVYRLYNENTGDHHYTMDAKERDNLIRAGWNDEGTGWYSDDAKTIPLYREYNPNAVTGTHNYTTDKAEHDKLVSVGWNDEGIGWYGIEDIKTAPPKEPDDETLKIGDTVILGKYEQDNDLTNGPEPILWQYVADKDGHKYLLSKYALDCKHNEKADNLNGLMWRNNTIRKWLNEDFYENAFSSEEKDTIVTALNKTNSITADYVFLMSTEEAQEYLDGKRSFSDCNPALMCRPTAYAVSKGVKTDSDGVGEGCCEWWLRSMGDTYDNFAMVYPWGGLGSRFEGYDYLGVRPAILID